ncbi:MAG: hypothetical protein P1S60_05460 [Anaerolineae bacterium]|nr:hypothetical protein [Anaerolineae bacterium]
MTENPESENPQPDLVYALTCLPESDICFAARGSGLYRSTDAGITWQSVYDELEFQGPLPTTSIILSPDMHIEPSAFAGVPGGVMQSMDAGETWQATAIATPPPLVSAMAISPNYVEDGVIFLGTAEDGVFRSANRGGSWSRWNFGLLDLAAYCFGVSPNYAEDETLYVGVESGLFCSTNGGRAWREVDLPVGYDPVVSLALSPSFGTDGILFAGTENQGLLQSIDQGRSWIRVSHGVIHQSVNGILLSPDFPLHPTILILHDDILLLSRDEGKTWAPLEVELADITACYAPAGLEPGATIMVGLLDGSVRTFVL